MILYTLQKVVLGVKNKINPKIEIFKFYSLFVDCKFYALRTSWEF